MMLFIIETIFLTAELAGCLKLDLLDILAARLENEPTEIFILFLS